MQANNKESLADLLQNPVQYCREREHGLLIRNAISRKDVDVISKYTDFSYH